jgi:carboxyl-terminal processing protease
VNLLRFSRPFACYVFLLLAACQRQPAPTPTTPASTPTASASPTFFPTATVDLVTATAEPQTTTPGMSAEARLYLEQALAIMEQHALYRQDFNWTRLKSRALTLAYNAITPADTYPAIQSALRNLNDSHSFFLTPQQVDDLMSGALQAGLPGPAGRLLENGLAYLSMPAFAGSMEAGTAYAARMQNILRELDTSSPCGWILDLRQNGGGDLWPMLAGVGPLLGDGLAGAFVDAGGVSTNWYYQPGQALQDSEVLIQVEAKSVYALKIPQPPVAVLSGQGTASSGEALMIAFRGRPQTRSFGRETAGLSTANERYTLSDGAQIYLTVSRFADRTGKVYGGIITPDEYISDDTSANDIVLDKASTWLLAQEQCVNK